MNIFFTNKIPSQCAKDHCRTHVVKMILEYTQLLCTTHRTLDQEFKDYHDHIGLYKATHVNHPSARWVRDSSEHYEWLYRTLLNLHVIYETDKGKEHKSFKLMRLLAEMPHGIVDQGWVDPYIAINPIDYPEPHEFLKRGAKVEEAYRVLMNCKYEEWATRTDKRPIKATWLFGKPNWVYSV